MNIKLFGYSQFKTCIISLGGKNEGDEQGILFPFLAMLVIALVFGGCSGGETSTPETTTPASSAIPVPEQPEDKTLKNRFLAWLGWPNGLDMVCRTESLVDMDNQKSGLEIGGERHQIELIIYDTDMSQATETAAVNRLIFEDKVKFIVTDVDAFMPSWIQTAEENKVVVVGVGLDYDICLCPETNYSFMASLMSGVIPSVTGWFCENHPELTESQRWLQLSNQTRHLDISGWRIHRSKRPPHFR